MNAMIRISNIAKDIKWKAKFLAPHPPFPGQSGSFFVSGKRLYILVNHGRESTAVLLIGEITTHVVGCNRWNQQVVPSVEGKQLSLHTSICRPGIWVFHCWPFVQFAIFSSPSKSMVELHFPTYLKWDENMWLVSITKRSWGNFLPVQCLGLGTFPAKAWVQSLIGEHSPLPPQNELNSYMSFQG